MNAAPLGLPRAYWVLWLGQFIWSSRDVVWMAPAGYLLVFGALALPLALIAALRPGWMPQRAVVFCFAAAAASPSRARS